MKLRSFTQIHLCQQEEEEQVKNANSMSTVHTIAKKAKDKQEKSAVEVGTLTKIGNTIKIIERLEVFLRTSMQTDQPELEEAGTALVFSCVLCLRYHPETIWH